MKSIFKQIILSIITFEAWLALKIHKPVIIGITGNIGKTTTKDNIAAALTRMKVRESKKSMNSEWGVPLTILGESTGWNNPLRWMMIILRGVKVIISRDYPKVLVLEIGADKKGDITNLMKWIKLDIGVITQFAEVPVHIENFKNRDEMIDEKSELTKGIIPGGLLIYNADCKDSSRIAARAKDGTCLMSFGKRTGDCKAHAIIDDIKNKNVHAQVIYNDKNYNLICTGVIGDSAIMCALPAVMIAAHFELDMTDVLKEIRDLKRSPGRMKILDGKSGSTIIDDSYNSSPLAVMNGLKTIGTTNVLGRKIVVLGDMLELGEYTHEEHKKIGREVARVAHVLVTVGVRAKVIAEGAMDNGMSEGWVLECDDSEQAGREVLNILKDGDLVYIKGSQGMRMERATKILLASHVNVKSSLPRQEDEWLSKK